MSSATGRSAARASPPLAVRAAAVSVGLLGGAALAFGPVTDALIADAWDRLVDLEVYREAGASVLAGRPIYEHRTPVPHLLPFTYPPIAALFAVPLAVVPLRVAEVLWTLSQVALLAWVLHRSAAPLLARAGAWSPALLGALTGGACRLKPVDDTLHFGQVNLIVVALCLAGCTTPWSRRGAFWRAGAFVGAATALKLTPGLVGIHLWLSGRRRAAVAAALVTLGAWLVAAIVLPRASMDFWGGALADSGRLGPNAGTSNQSLRGVLLRLGPGGPAGSALWLCAAVAVAVIALRSAAHAARRGDDVRALAMVGLTAVLVSPVSWIHHLAWVVVAIAVITGDGRSLRRLAVAGVAAAYFLVPVPWEGIEVLFAQGPVWWGRLLQQGFFLGALVLLAILALVREVRLEPPVRSVRAG